MSKGFAYLTTLIQHKLSILRDEKTSVKEFRELVSETAVLICYEATRDLPLRGDRNEDPHLPGQVPSISGHKLAFVPILRAGLGMIDGMVTSLVPAAKIGHIGLFRDPETKLNPVKYYFKLPADIAERDVIVVDTACHRRFRLRCRYLPQGSSA